MSGLYSQGNNNFERDTTLRDLLGVVFRRKWLILGIFLATTVFVGWNTLTSPVTYTAHAKIMLNRAGARASMLERPSNALPWVEVIESEVEVVGSSPVLQGALDRLAAGEEDLGLDARQLAKSIKVGVIGESNVLYVSCTARRPSVAIRISNAVADSYVEYHDVLYKLPDASGLIKTRVDSTFTILSELQSRRGALLSSVGLTNLEEEEHELIRQRYRLIDRLSGSEVISSRLDTEIRDMDRFLAEGNLSMPINVNTGSAKGTNLSQSIRDAKVKRDIAENLSLKYTDKHPPLQEAKASLALAERTTIDLVRQILEEKRHELRVSRAEQYKMRSLLAGIEGQLATLPDLTQQLAVLDTKIKATTRQYEELSKQSTSSDVSAASMRKYGVKLLSPAVNADQNKRGDMVRLALGPLLSLVAGLGLAFYLENLDHSLQNREDVERHLEIPVLASFPDVAIPEEETSQSSRTPFQRGKSR